VTSALTVEQLGGYSTKDSSPKPPPRILPPVTPIPFYPDDTAISQVPRLSHAVRKEPAPTCVISPPMTRQDMAESS